MDITLPLTNKISAGMRIQRYLWLLKLFKSSTNLSCKLCGKVWNQPQKDRKSAYNQNHLNPGNNFLTDHVPTASGFAPTR